MKKNIFTILLLFITLNLNAQDRKNRITPTEFKQIAINNVTIQQLYDCKGVKEKYIALFGTPSKIDTQDFSFTLYYQNNFVHIDNDLKAVGTLDINDTAWSIKIKGNVFKVGDSVTKFQQVFGTSLKVIVPPNNQNKKFISFSYQGNDYDSIYIDIDPQTNKVKQISYFVIP